MSQIRFIKSNTIYFDSSVRKLDHKYFTKIHCRVPAKHIFKHSLHNINLNISFFSVYEFSIYLNRIKATETVVLSNEVGEWKPLAEKPEEVRKNGHKLENETDWSLKTQ